MENLSAVLYKQDDLRMEDRPARDPEKGEVQIAVHNSGVCMTDVHIHDHGCVDTDSLVVTSPVVIGHEFSGVVSKVGPDVTIVKPGDRVTVDNLVACGFCHLCKLGHSNVCLNFRFIGFPPYHGGLARLATVSVHSVHRIPDSLSMEEAALMEPLSVCVNACQRAHLQAGQSVLVQGAGAIGLMTLQVARASGASVVCVTDIHEERLELARELGATHTVLFSEEETDARTNADKLTKVVGEDFDVAIECSGVSVCLQTAVYAVRSRGVVAMVGIGASNVSVPVVQAILREVDLRGCVCNNYCFPTAIKLAASQKVRLKPIVSHRFPLEQLPHALDLIRERKAVKVVINCRSK